MTTPTATEPCPHPEEKVEYDVRTMFHQCECGVSWPKGAKKPRPGPRVPFSLMREVQKRAEHLTIGGPGHLIDLARNAENEHWYESKSKASYEAAIELGAQALKFANETGHEPPVEEVKVPEPPQGCQHVVVPEKPGWGGCLKCGEGDFPLTPEAAGECPSCGGHGSCPEDCDGRTPRMPWALALRALSNLAQHMASSGVSAGLNAGSSPGLDLVEEDLHRITGNLRTYPIPIKGTGRTVLVEYLGTVARRITFHESDSGDELGRVLESLGLRLKNAVEYFSLLVRMRMEHPVFVRNAERGTITAEVEPLSTRVETP